MAHFAQLDENNMVIWVTYLDNSIITDENSVEQESLGIQYIHDTITDSENYTWKQCSYNNNFRGKYPAYRSVYVESLDIFTYPKPFDSWIFNTNILEWQPPIPRPNDIITDSSITRHNWNEETLSWEPVIDEKPHSSWILMEESLLWIPPVEYPTDGKGYQWNEETQSWELT